MHRLFPTLLFLLLSIAAYSQQYMDTHDPKEIKSLLNKKNDINGFGSVDVKITDILGDRTLIAGGYGTVFINHFFMFGVAGYGLVTSPEFEGELPDGTEKNLNLTGGYAGLVIGGKVFSKEIVHLSIPIILGGGGVQVSDQNFFPDDLRDTEFTIERSTFFVVEPGAELEINLTNNLRLAFGATYRYVKEVQLRNLEDEDLINWSGMVSLKFGRF